jgi:glyoxylase-like metal-dependent hydrolase (beta-lactamase superfamily II)
VIAAKNRDPRIQVMQYNEDTFVLRQNVCVNWQGPFSYLLFGNRGALLIDTGATPEPQWYPLRQTVDALIAHWQGIRRKPSVPLTIAHTSAEASARNAGLIQFAGRAATTVVPRHLDAMQSFYGLSISAPQSTGRIDLGDRLLDVLPTPGTHRDGISFYDRYTNLLFTGDLIFPGKIQIANDRDYIASIERLQQWKTANPVKWVLGGHIDMQFLPGRAYGRFGTFKPYERDLQMLPALIDDALETAKQIAGKQMAIARSDFWMIRGVGPDQRPTSFPEGLPNINAPRPA